MYYLCLILMLLIIIVTPVFIYTYFLLQRPQITPPSSADHPPARAAVALGKSDLVTVVVVVAKSEEAEGGGECSVCLSAFEAGEELWQLNLCRHLFHAPCIERWLHAHSNCPVCRAYIKTTTPPPPKAPAVARASTRARDDFWQGLPDSAGLV